MRSDYATCSVLLSSETWGSVGVQLVRNRPDEHSTVTKGAKTRTMPPPDLHRHAAAAASVVRGSQVAIALRPKE